MRFIIDTHIFVWFLEGNTLLSPKYRRQVADGRNDVFDSIASFWEIGIKLSVGKLDLSGSIPAMFRRAVVDSINILPIREEYIVEVSALPFHHRDPFDRMIIAQAIVEDIPLMTLDKHFSDCGVELL